MTVKDLRDVARYSAIELHSAYDGKLIASSHKSIEKFGDVEVLSVLPQIKVTSSSCDYARAYLYVYVDHNQAMEIKEGNK